MTWLCVCRCIVTYSWRIELGISWVELCPYYTSIHIHENTDLNTQILVHVCSVVVKRSLAKQNKLNSIGIDYIWWHIHICDKIADKYIYADLPAQSKTFQPSTQQYMCTHLYMIAFMRTCINHIWWLVHTHIYAHASAIKDCGYGVATISRLLKNIGLFYKRAL